MISDSGDMLPDASTATLGRLEKSAERTATWSLHQVLVEQCIVTFTTAPIELVLAFDATDNPLLFADSRVLWPAPSADYRPR